MVVGVSFKIRVASWVSQTLQSGWHLKCWPCSERWGKEIALVWIVKVNFYKLYFIGLGDRTGLLPFFSYPLWVG